MPTKIAALSVSAGAGHVRAAEALRATATQQFPGVTVEHVDLMTLMSKLFRHFYAESYVSLVQKHPILWGYLYDQSDADAGDTLVRRSHGLSERLSLAPLRHKLEELQPDHVICTHFLPAILLARLIQQGKFARPVWVQVTDFDIHGLWLVKHMNGYFAGNDEVAWRMQDRGIPGGQIRVTGIPIMPVFSQRLDRATCLREVGLDPAQPTVLLMAGGMGVGDIDVLAARLLALQPANFQLIALAGRNEKLLAKLQAVAAGSGGRMVAVGFTTTIERLMTASDLAVTKPGGLTTSECLAMGLPMVIVSPIPGQEERNADYLLEQGVALAAPDAAGLEFRVRKLMGDPAHLARMRAAALGCARPHAARDVLRTVLGQG